MGHVGFAEKGRDRGKGLMHLLVVRPDMRRKGAGGQLLNSCESFLVAAGTVTVGLIVKIPFTAIVHFLCFLSRDLQKGSESKPTNPFDIQHTLFLLISIVQ